jgi:hypothetical protein
MYKRTFMNKNILLYFAAIAFVITYVGTSCKKPVHSNAPTPNNSRLLSYTKLTSITSNTLPNNGIATINENYRFYYDNLNRLVKIIYTTNDTVYKQHVSTFTYSNDTVFKETINAISNALLERDTLIYNNKGQLIAAYTPHLTTTFNYFGKLLATYTKTATTDTNDALSATYTYTSVDGDLLQHNFDGKLTATIRPDRTLNFQTTWYPINYLTISGMNFTAFSPNISHKTDFKSYTDFITGYTDGPMAFVSTDTLNHIDTTFYPGEEWRNESYHFYTEMANRIGDYLTLQSFTMYGYNIYQNKHLVESISSTNRHANIDYSIDAYSNITQTRVVLLDSVLNKFNYVYDIQYETY